MTNFNKENKKTIMAISFATVVTLTLIFAPSAILVDAAHPAAPKCFEIDPGNPLIERTATIYKKFPTDNTSDLWVTPGGDKNMTRLSSGGFDGWKVGGSKNPDGDVIVGSWLSDQINGGKGNDVICGDDPRADTIGDDKISGGHGDDQMWGTYGFTDIGPDEDELRGGLGNDVMWGQGGPDTIIGGQGDDKAFCSQADNDGADDVVKLGRGNDSSENCDLGGDTVNLGNKHE